MRHKQVDLKKEISIEISDSLENLMKSTLGIEIYSYSLFNINILCAYAKKSLIEIIKGGTKLNFTIKNNHKSMNNALFYVEFRCYFQEIRDFQIYFNDWVSANLNSLFNINNTLVNKKKPKLKVEIKFLNSKGGCAETEYIEMNE